MVESLPGCYVAAGFNGHGIMHGPPVAEAVAELIVNGRSESFDLAPLTPGRFSSGITGVERVSSLF
jgi:glycine/D-amino acid oxidase-like deaminating enzyme